MATGKTNTARNARVEAANGLHPDDAGTIFGHPKGLAVLFLTEMWERMSYYGMRALLILYMVNYLFVDPVRGQEVLGFNGLKSFLQFFFGPLETQPFASLIYGFYTGFVYLTPFFGGMIADRWWGKKKTVVVGAVLMTIGHFLMASENLFFIALLFLIVGNGAFKPNISTQVGDLYAPGDDRRDRAFTLFYMGINLGAVLSPLICGSLGQKLGWHWGFGAAGVGMILGLIIYLWGQKYVKPHPKNIVQQTGPKEKAEKVPFTAGEKKAVWALVALAMLNIVFWAVYEQQGNTMQLWADSQTNWPVILGFQIPSTWYQSLNPLMILIFAPLLNVFWGKQSLTGKEPSSVTKMGIGCLLLGAAFAIMILAAQMVGSGQGSMLWLVVTTFVLTIGELYLSPIGLSLVTKVAPARIVSMMMGVWLMSSFFGNILSGALGMFYTSIPKAAFFGIMAALAVVAGLAMAAFNKPLRAALGGKH